MLARASQIGVDQQGSSPELGQRDRQVGGEEGLAVSGIRAHHGQRAARRGAIVEDSLHHLAADGPEGLGLGREGFVQHHQFGAELALGLGRVGIVVLLRQRKQHIVGAGQPELDGRFTEAHTRLALVGHDAFDLFGFELARLGDEVADGAIEHVGRARRGVGQFDDFRSCRRLRPLARWPGPPVGDGPSRAHHAPLRLHRAVVTAPEPSLLHRLQRTQQRQPQCRRHVLGAANAAIHEFEQQCASHREQAAQQHRHHRVQDDLGRRGLQRRLRRGQQGDVALRGLALQRRLVEAGDHGFEGTLGAFDIANQHRSFVARRLHLQHLGALRLERGAHVGTALASDAVADADTADDTQGFGLDPGAQGSDVGFRFQDLRVLGSQAGIQLLQPGLRTRDLGTQGTDQGIVQDLLHLVCRCAARLGLAAARLRGQGLQHQGLRRQLVQARRLDVQPFVAGDDAHGLLEGRQLGLGLFQRLASFLGTAVEERRVLLGRVDAQRQAGFQIGLHEGIRHAGREVGVGCLVRDADHARLARRLDFQPPLERIEQPGLDVAHAGGGIEPLRAHLGAFGELEVSQHAPPDTFALQDLHLGAHQTRRRQAAIDHGRHRVGLEVDHD